MHNDIPNTQNIQNINRDFCVSSLYSNYTRIFKEFSKNPLEN